MYKNTQHYRHTVHMYLDAIWSMGSNRSKARTAMYKWLSIQMDIPLERTHVKYFTRAQCRQAIKILRARYIQLYGKDVEYSSRKNKRRKDIMYSNETKDSKDVAMDFLEENKSLVQHLIEDEHYTYLQIVEYFSKDIDLEPWWVGQFSRKNKFCAFKNKSYSKLGDKNPSKNIEVREKISDSIKKLWEEGVYENSHLGENNGMFNKKYLLHPRYCMTRYYKEKLEYYQPDNICECCGKRFGEDEKYDIHHIDENHDNILLTNLQKLCVACHQRFHTSVYKQPYVTVEIQHELQYGHRLPDYDGKCYFTHGHRGLITLRVKRRIDPKTGFAIDFNELKAIIKTEIDDVLDHEYLNNYMENPTTEFTVIWLWCKLSKTLKGIESISFAEGSKTQVTLTKEDMLNSVLNGQYESEWIPEEYRRMLEYDFNLDTDLPDVDSVDGHTISTLLNSNTDWSWFYKLVSIIQKELRG